MPAELMLVADAPGFHDDRPAARSSGATGELLDELLGSIGLARARRLRDDARQVPPAGNAEPAARTRSRPAATSSSGRSSSCGRGVVAALGDLATRALAGGPHGVSQLHGQVRRAEIAGHAITLLPLYHPAAALLQRALAAVAPGRRPTPR